MAFNIRKRNTGETGAATTPASAPRTSAPVVEEETDKRRGFNIRKAEAAVPVSRAAETPANNGYAPARNVLDDLDRQNELYRLALETERADELDKSNAPSASRQAAQRAQKNQRSGKYNGVDRQALARGAGQALKDSMKAAGDFGADLVDSFISGGGNSAWGGTVFGTLTALDEATGNAMNKVLGKITGDEKYNEPFVSPFREYAEYHSGQAADTLQRVTEDKSWLRQQVMKAGSAAGNMLFSSSLASLGAGSGVGMGAQFGGTQAGLGASAAQRATSAITGAAARLGNEIIANPGNALISLGSGGSTYIDATNRGAEQGGALMNAVGAGLLEYMSNKLFGGMPIENAGDEQGYVMMLAQKVVERLGKSEAMQNFLNTTGGQAVTWIVDKLGEGLEEVVTEFFDPMIERLTWNPEAALATLDEIADAFAGGVALSLLMSGGEALIDNTGKVLSPATEQDEEAQRMEALVRLAQQMEETAAAEEAAPADQPVEQPVKAPIEQPITPPVEPTQEIKPTMPTTQPTLAQAERAEPPAGNLTPEETKGAEAQETPSPATQQRTEAETEKPKAGIYRAEKTGLPFDVVFEPIKTEPTTSEKPLQTEPPRGTMEETVSSETFTARQNEQKPAASIKNPAAWEDVIDSGRVSGMTKGEQNAVKNIFEKPKAEQKQTSVSATAEKTAETEPIESKPAENGDKASNPQQQIADAVRRSIEKGIAFNSARLFEIADKAFGGTMAEGKYTVKDAYDGMELAVNQYLMNNRSIRESANGDVLAAQRALTQLQDLLAKLPTQTKRSAEQESYQQFSTPPNIAYLAAWAANVNRNDVVLEPSAGIGGLALWPKAWGATVYGNELSKRRLAFLDKLGLDGTFNLNAEQINNLLPDEIKPTVVLMNPPFSATAGRTATNNTANAKRHIEQALDRLEDGGRLVAILGNGMSDDAKAFRSWWDDLRKENSIRANIRIDGENYKKYGTTFDVQLVVIDKTGAQTGETITGEYKDLSEVLNLLEEIRNDRTRVDTRSQTAAGTVRHGVLESGSDSGTHADGEKRPVGGLRSDGGNVGRGAESGAAARPGNRGTAGGRRSGTGDQNGVQGVSESGQRAEVQGKSGGAESGRADGSGSRSLQLDRGDNTLARQSAAKDAAANPDSIYSTYVPRKARIKGSKPHPAKLVESAAMAAVEPPDVTYTPNLPENVVKDGILSDAQLENVIYAGQAHEQMLPNGTRKGFFIGDGTGVGKGRQIAGIIMDNFRQGRGKALWISEKAALVNDAQRDWTALGGKADDVIDIKKIKYKKGEKIKADSGILFSSYDTLKTDKDARLRMLKDWLGEDFDGVIALDEAHNMGNANGKKGVRGKTKPSAKALAGIDLQNAFPNARVVYASATGATEASNYAYLQRLGLWGKGTAFHDFNDFMSKISNGGLAAMELVARDMKAMGEYMARSISYDDVTYDELTHELTPMQTEIYNTMSKAWQKVMQNVNKALEVTGQAKDGNARGRAMSAIFGTQQRFYNQILTSMSMPSVIEDMKRELANGRSCVLQLVNTNAAAAERAIAKNAEEGGDLDDLDLTPSDMLIEMVQHSFPVELYEPYTDEEGRDRSRPVLDAEGKPVIDKKAVKMRDALIDELRMMKVPDGPLEMLFDAFGVENVAEVTGRTRRVVEKKDETGARKRVIENRTNNSGIADANMFQDGKKRILVFSDAGGTGRSYHADLTAKNQQQRVHYLLQPGWEASKAVQGFGRTHRSNQASAPIFRLITTNVMGQKRFTSTIARRLDQLGALTKGQRQAGSGVFGEKDNLENPIAEDALSRYYRTVDPALLKKLGLYDKIYDEWGRFNDKSEALRDIGKFLNRILSLEVDEQNRVFQGFYDTFDRFMDIAIANGTVDMGLENYRADKIDVVDEKTVRKDPTGADTKYVQMTAYRKPEITPFSKVKGAHQNFQGIVRTEDGSVRAVYEISSKTNAKTGEIQRRFKLESPVNGKGSTYVEETLKAQTKPIDEADWKEAWEDEIAKAPEYNTSTLHLLTGTLLPIWDRLPQDNTRVMRVMSSDGRQYLGRVIRPDQIDSVLRGLGANRTVKHYTGSEVQANVMQGKEAAFERDRLKLIRRRVSGEWRMELTGPNVWFIARQYSGLITEKINYQPRYFVPTGESGNKVLDEIMKHNPVIDIRDAAPETVDESRNTKNDHSDQWTATRINGGEAQGASSLSDIIEKIRHDFGANVTTGHIRGSGVRGQYNRKNHGIRTKIANDLPTAAHELGHHLDNVYGLRDHLSPEIIRELENGLSDEMRAAYPNQKKWRTEGIAEYFRKYLQNRETASIDYPTFTAYWKGLVVGRDAALIDQLADEVNAYYSLDADTATSSIRSRSEAAPDARTFGEKIRAKYDTLYQQWADSNHGIKRFTEEVGDNKAYIMATNAAYRDAIAGAIITGDLRDADGRYVSPGLGTVLHGVNLKSKSEYRLFGEYLAVKHGPERLAEGMRIFADDRKNSTAWMKQRQEQLEEQHPEFEAASERLYQFIGDLYQTWGVDTGLIGEDTLKEWRERWQYYVPLNRAVPVEARGRGARRGFANQNSTVKRAHGSGLDIINPVDNLIDNLVRLVNAGTLNNVMRTLTDAADQYGADASFLERVPVPLVKQFFNAVGLKKNLANTFMDSNMSAEDKATALDTIGNIDDLLEQYKKGKAHGDVVTVMKHGEQEFWKINDPLLLQSLTNLAPQKQGAVVEAYAHITRFMTSAITGNDVIWGLFSNFPRDLQTIMTYTGERNKLNLLAAIGESYVNKFKGNDADPLYLQYLALGGGQGLSAYTADRNLADKARRKLSGDKLQWLNPLEWLAYISDTIESGPRYATFKMCVQKGMTPQEAIYAAHDITVNFRKAGVESRTVNKFIPYFNAGVQGLDKYARWLGAEDTPKNERSRTAARRALMYLAVNAALGTLFYALNNRDDEDRENYQQLSNYTKNSYWLFPLGDGKYFAIPKARELSVPASLFETLAERVHGGNKHAFDDFLSYASDNYLPPVVSDIASMPESGIEQAGYGAMSSLGIAGVGGSILANRDYLGKPIVSAGMQYYEPRDQYNERTSKLAKTLGEGLNYSPQKIDYAMQQILGGYWKAQKNLFPVGSENVDLTLGVQNRYVKDNQYSTDLINWLFDKAEASAAAKKSDPANTSKAVTAAMDSRMTDFYTRYYKLAKNTTEAQHGTRQIVLNMIKEYQKDADNGFVSPTLRMVYDVCEREGDTEFLPSTMQSSIKDGNKADHLLSDVQYVEYQTDYLRRYYEYVETALPAAKNEREETAILRAAKSYAKDTATDAALKRIGAPTGDAVEKYGSVSEDKVIQFKAALDLADDDGGLSQQEVIDAIDALRLSRSQSSTLFHTRYDSDKNNPYKR